MFREREKRIQQAGPNTSSLSPSHFQFSDLLQNQPNQLSFPLTFSASQALLDGRVRGAVQWWPRGNSGGDSASSLGLFHGSPVSSQSFRLGLTGKEMLVRHHKEVRAGC